jgi:nucleoside-diphosphate-sugar epimerase
MVKRALVTGSAGFIGRHTVAHLDSLGWWDVDVCDVKYGDLDPYDKDANWLFHTNDRRYDLVIHAAYHVGGRIEIDGKPANLHLNAQLDANLFEWAVRTKQRHVVYFSSSAAYPTALQEDLNGYRLRESDIDFEYPFKPDGRYGQAKLHGEHMAQAARECGVPVTVLRPFSGYGEDQDLTYPFPAFVRRALDRTDPFTIWGTMNQRRDFIHVDDVIEATMKIVEAETNQPINLCTGVATTMYDLAKIVISHINGYEPVIDQDLTKPMGVLNRVGDPHSMWKYHQPKIDIYEGVTRAMKGKS